MSDIPEIAAAIRALGVRQVFSVPGGGATLDLLDDLERSGVSIATPNHESAAGLMAAVNHRLSGVVGVATSIKGPGLANLLPALACSSLERWSLVTISEAFDHDVPPSIVHKRLDHAALTSSVVKAHGWCSAGDDITRAAELASAEEPGCVSLDLSHRSGIDHRQPDPCTTQDGREFNALELLRRAQRPAVIVGSRAGRLGLSDQLNELAIPVFTTAAAKGVVDERKAHSAGVFTGAGLAVSPEKQILPHADLVVGIGLRSGELLKSSTGGLPTVLIDDHPSRHSPGIIAAGMLGDKHMAESLEMLGGTTWRHDAVVQARRVLDRVLRGESFSVANVLTVTQDHLGPLARLVVDTGDFCTVAEHTWIATSWDRFIGASNSRFMGVGIPLAIGSSIADPNTPTVLAVGDGGIGPHFGELELAVERRLPILVLLMSDGGMSSIIGRAEQSGRSTKFLLRSHRRWLDAASGIGLRTWPASCLDHVCAAVSEWVPGEGPAIIECRFDPEQYRRTTANVR